MRYEREIHDCGHSHHHLQGWHARGRGERGGQPLHGHRHGHAAVGFEGRGERGGRGGARRRMFETGELRVVLLRLLEDHPRHGYDFIRELDARSGGSYTPSPGVIYPTLTLLEELGYVEAVASEGAKQLFSITTEGRAHLEERRAEAEQALERLKTLGAENNWFESGPVWRALQNLKTVLHERLSNAHDKRALFEVAELLDEAAQKIERLELPAPPKDLP
jgi:DNA-binding PadR family transcriptional regulator